MLFVLSIICFHKFPIDRGQKWGNNQVEKASNKFVNPNNF